MAAAGDLCFHEFSGYEPYYATYDTTLVGDPNAVYIIVVSMLDPPSTRRRQLEFWLDFVRCRTTPLEPVGTYPVRSCLLFTILKVSIRNFITVVLSGTVWSYKCFLHIGNSDLPNCMNDNDMRSFDGCITI